MTTPVDTLVNPEAESSPAFLIRAFQQQSSLMHEQSRRLFWERNLPFYTTLGQTGISRKEYPDGRTELVRRHTDECGNLTDEVIATPVLSKSFR